MEEKLISKKKPFFKISPELASFLRDYERWIDTPVCYDDLLRFSGSVVVYYKNDNDTFWVRVYYSDSERREIEFSLKKYILSCILMEMNQGFHISMLMR